MSEDDGSGSRPDSFIDRLRRENALAARMASSSAERDGDASAAKPVPATRATEEPASLGLHPATASSPESDEPADSEGGGAHPDQRMPHEGRRALVSLMRQGIVLAAKKAKVFEALVRHETPIRVHLDELYLQLVLDESAGVAFIRNRPPGEGAADEGIEDDEDDAESAADGATLIARRTLSLYDTLLLLILRKHYQERQSAGEQRIVVDIERIESAFVPFLPLTASERSDRRQLNAALTRLVDKRLLSRVRGDDARFEITPVIRYVVDATFLESLLDEYRRLAGDSDDAPDTLATDGLDAEASP